MTTLIEGYKISFDMLFSGFEMLFLTLFHLFQEITGQVPLDEYEPIGSIFSITFSVIGIGCSLLMLFMLCVLTAAIIAGIIFAIVSLFKILFGYVFPAIPLFVIAKRNNCKFAWFAFIPVLQTYLEFIIPKSDFKALFFNSQKEKRKYYAIASIILSVILPIISALSIGNVYIGVIWILTLVVYLSFCQRKMFDLMNIYFSKKTSMILSIISLFIPIVYLVTLIVMMCQNPKGEK